MASSLLLTSLTNSTILTGELPNLLRSSAGSVSNAVWAVDTICIASAKSGIAEAMQRVSYRVGVAKASLNRAFSRWV